MIHEYETLIDSSEVELRDWIRMANDIELNYASYDAFLILHGTDSTSSHVLLLLYVLDLRGIDANAWTAPLPQQWLIPLQH